LKKKAICALSSLMMFAFIASTAFAQPSLLPGYGWWFGMQIQNVGSSSTTVYLNTYDAASSTYYLKNRSVGPKEYWNVISSDFSSMPLSFQGSSKANAQQDIRAIVNTTNRYISSLGLGDPESPSPAAGQYQAMRHPSTTLRFPLAKNDYYGKTTTFYIQNAGDAAINTAYATFIFNGTTYYYNTPPIGAGQMVEIVPRDAIGGGEQPPVNSVGSLTVTASEPLAGVVMEKLTSESHATLLQTTRAFTPADADTILYAPINKNDYHNRFTGIQVQNVDSSGLSVTVTYYQTYDLLCPGGSVSITDYIPPNESLTFDSFYLGEHCFASAKIQANGQIVATVNEAFSSSFMSSHPGHAQEATIYSVIPNHVVSKNLSVPIFKEDSYSKQSGLSIQNVSGSNASVVATFKNASGQVFTTNPMIIPARQAIVLFELRGLDQLNPTWWNGWSGAPMTSTALGCNSSGCGANGLFSVTVTSNQSIVGIANESTYPVDAPRILQDKSNYEAFNLYP